MGTKMFMPGMGNRDPENDPTLSISIFIGKLCTTGLFVKKAEMTSDYLLFDFELPEHPRENEALVLFLETDTKHFHLCYVKNKGKDRVQIHDSYYEENRADQLREDMLFYLRSGVPCDILHSYN
jgi:hypothetical protein